METQRTVNIYEIMEVVRNLQQESERISQLKYNLQNHLDAIHQDWDTKRKQKFLNELEQTRNALSTTASMIQSLAAQVQAIPGKMYYENAKKD
ncbi:hypothetical protein [Aneurinibacillus tyrosinisolvens]|uniref:hypothetical protein n=1 Tax=Aneurinibacillus tyrosinisolvens TaxID=1443435 RepID=UPI00063F380B|nr:hypothetical protein [Aneurinibacillus tyrosinisolvens]